MLPSRRAVQALLAAAAWLKSHQELQWLIGAGQGIIQSSSARGETARSLTSTALLLARAAKRPGRVPSLEQLLESDDYFVRVKSQGSLPEEKDKREQQAGAPSSSTQTTPSRYQQRGQQEQQRQQLGQGHASGHEQKREQGQRQQALNDRGQAGAAGPGRHAYGRLLAREFEDEVSASTKPPTQSAREPQVHAGPSKVQQQHSAKKASSGKSDASSLNAARAAQQQQQQQQDHTTTAKALWQQTFASKHQLDGHPGVVGSQSRLAALQQDSSTVGPAPAPAAQEAAAARVSGPRGATQEQRQTSELGYAKRDALRSGFAGLAAVAVGQQEPGRHEGREQTLSQTQDVTPPHPRGRKPEAISGSSPRGAEGNVDSTHMKQMSSTADAGGAPDLGLVQEWGKGSTWKQWGGRRSEAQPGAARGADWQAAVPGRAAYDALLGTVRHARHLPDLLAALRQHLRHGSPVSPRGTAQAVATAARLLDRGMLSRASPSGPGAALGAGALPSTATGLSDEAAEVMRFITEHAMPVVRVGLHSLPPQDLVPLTWGVAKLRLASDSELVESLLRELLAEDAEAIRCRGGSGALMVAQALCHLQSQGCFGARPGRTNATPPAFAAQVPSVAIAASTPSAEALQPATGPGNLPGVQGLGMGGEGLGLQDLSSSSLADDGGQEPSAGLIWQGIEAAQGATQQQQVWDSEQAAALAQLSQQLVQHLGRTAQQLLAAMRMPQVAGIASCLARLRYQDAAFFNAAAAKALQHLDSTTPFVLSLLLRALAEANAHVPALLAAAEPFMVEGVLGGHFTHKGLKDVLHPYTQASHPCPTLLPIISQAAADAAASGSMDDRSLRAIATRASSLGPLHPALATALDLVDATAVAAELRG